MIGPYLLGEVLGHGGMGVVHRAHDAEGRPVAVKLLRATLGARGARRFAREGSVRVEHPNVIRTLAAGVTDEGTAYLVLELLEGEGLDGALARGPLPFAEVRALGMQACAGLHAAHALGIVHRDVKPSNLFVCRDGTLKVLDFGTALVEDAHTRLTTEGGVVGTPAYLSPEQAHGVTELDARSDLWSLGVVLYEALTGRPPFQRSSALATMLAIVREQVPPLGSLRPDVPPSLASAIERALRRAPEERWSSAVEMRAALEAADTASVNDAGAGLRAVTLVPGGERRVVAVLLAEEVVDLAALERAVVERGGVLVRLRGGRAIGLFGAERWEGDEAARAVAAALDARAAAARIGVASGRAKLEGAAVSGTVLDAAEEACAAALDGVAVDVQTARGLPGGFLLRWRDDHLVEATAELAGTPPSAEPPRRPLLGRSAELDQLRQSIASAIDEERSASVLVMGPAGIGKSRLRAELEQLLADRPEPFQVLVGRAEPARRESALSLFAAVLRARARGAPQSVTRSTPLPSAPGPLEPVAVVRLVADALGDRSGDHATFLGVLMGVAMPETDALRAARRDPQLMSDRLRLSLQDYFEALGRRGPLALLVEDVQWADAASVALFADLLDRLSDTAFVLFATARPELDEARIAALGGADLLRLAPRGLSTVDVAVLAEHVAGRPLPEPQVRAIAQRTGGNPLFVEQTVVALSDAGLLDADVAELPLPLTVEAAVQSRLDHLPADEKDLCKRVSVFGRPFTMVEAESLGVVDPTPLLAALVRRELLSARGRSRGRRELQFRSTLVAEVAYRMIGDAPRAELHRRAAAHLARTEGADPEEIAAHHEQGGEPAAAAARFVEATSSAARRGDGPATLRCAGRALALGAPAAALHALHMARADVLVYLGKRDEQAHALDEALASALTDAARASVLSRQAARLARAGRSAEALATAQRAVAAARAAADIEVLIPALGHHAAALISAGRVAEAAASLDEATALAAAASVQVQALTAGFRAELAGARGDLGRRLQEFRDAVALYGRAGDVRRAAHAESNLADTYNRVGAYAEAETALRAAIAGCRRVGQRLTEGYALVNLGYALAMQGRTEAALAALDEAEVLAATSDNAFLRSVIAVYRARALLGQADAKAAGALAEVAARDAEAAGLPVLRVLALSVAARARRAEGAIDAALAFSLRAMALLDELGGLEEDEADVIVEHAWILRDSGDEEGARRMLERGRRRVAEVAKGITDLEWRRRYLEDVAANRALISALE